MAIEWSGLSLELVRLDRSASQPLRAQLEASPREAIRGGRLRAGERLPSSRELGVSRGMVQDCYGQLLAERYLTGRTGSATQVAGISGQRAGDQPVAGPAAVSPSAPSPGRHPWEPPLPADFQPRRTGWASTSPTCQLTSEASRSANWRPAQPRLS